MTTDPVIKQLTQDRDNTMHRIANHVKKIAHLNERLTHSLMPNQMAMLQAQRSRHVTLLDADEDELIDLEKSLAAEIASQS